MADGTRRVRDLSGRERDIVADLIAEARGSAPRGALVEDKGLSLVLHWRSVPAGQEAAASSWARALAEAAAAAHGFEMLVGRRVVEVRVPAGEGKGDVVRELCGGLTAICFLGDDLGDLAAFDALDDLARSPGLDTLRVAVLSDETPPALAARADLTVEGPDGALELIDLLLQ